MPVLPPPEDAVLLGPFWPTPVRVIKAAVTGDSVRVQAVSITNGEYFDRLLTRDQYEADVQELVAGIHTFDASPRLFRLATEALRTHLAHVFDPQFAVSVSQVDPLPHQIEAVYRRILPLPRIRFLLADDPGAGKTIMAGLLMRELMQRQDVRRVLVLCPKALTDQWRREMWERFKQRFVLVTGETVSTAFGQNAWMDNNLVVASVDLGVQPHIEPGLEQAEWDLVIFDEAHKLSAYRYGSKIEKTQRYQLAEKLAQKTRHLLLMTATPHKGDPENFRLLLSLLDPDVFASAAGAEAAIDPDASPYFLRRMKETMRDWYGRPLFLPRHVTTPPYDLNEHESDLYQAVTDYVQRGIRLADESAEGQVRRNVGLALTILQRRLTSSLYAVTRSLERRRDRLSDELDTLRKSGRTPVGLGSDTIDYDEEEDDSDQAEEAVSKATAARSVAELQTEVEELNRLVAHARRAMGAGPERKVEELERVIREQTVSDRAEKILIFTEHRDTLEYLASKLRGWGNEVCVIHGGMKLQDRIAAEKQFRQTAQFMVATDAAGEGINLQFCRVMINWDLPWNPNRLEQRMGRIHRYGQQFEVQIFNLVAKNTREGQVLVRLMEKLDRMRDALGNDQVFDVIQEVLEVGHVRLDLLMREAILGRRSLDDVLNDLDVLDSGSATSAAKEALGEALATRFIDMAFLTSEDRESRERRLTPEFVERFFVDALQHLGGKLVHQPDQTWRLDHVPVELRRLAAASNTGETGTENRLITFRKERLRQDPPAEFLAPDHPLFDAVEQKVLEEGAPMLARGTVFTDPNAAGPYFIWLLEAAVVNGSGHVVHQRLLGLRQTGETFEAVEPGVLLDLAPTETAPAIPPDLLATADGDRAVNAAAAFYTSDYVSGVRAQQEREVEVISRALERSIGDTLERLQTTLERQITDQDAGKDMGIAIRTTNEAISTLMEERDHRRAELQRRTALTLVVPRVVGVAAVLPGPIPAAWQQGLSGGNKKEIELAGMRVAMDFERALGRTPEDVSNRGCGYDIRSVAADSSVRYIEVKAHTTAGDVTLYYTEWQMANRLREEFFIYEVEQALSAPSLRIIQDPVGKGIEPVEKVVEYRIEAAKLAAHAVPAEWPR